MANNQLQQPLIVYPAQNETVDATSSSVVFYVKIRGVQCIKYTIYLYDVATNTLHYTSTVTLGSTLYDGDQLNMTVNMASYGADSYYWKVDLYWSAASYITSNFYTFNASTPPTIAFNPVVPATITTPSYQFIGAYAQAESVTVKNFEIALYDSVTTQLQITAGTAVPLLTSGTTWSNNIRYTFNGLSNGISYQVQITGLTQQNIAFATALTAFTVAYTVPVSLAHPTAVLNTDSSVTLTWDKIVSILGVITGSSSYATDYLFTGNIGLHLEASAFVRFAVDFSAPFTVHWIATPEAGFTGDLGQVEDTAVANYINLGYDGTKFYLNVCGDYYYDAPEALSAAPYILAIISDGVTISMYHREVV